MVTLPGPSALGRLVTGVGARVPAPRAVASTVRSAVVGSSRRTWSQPGRAHIELRRDGSADGAFAGALVDRLRALDGVDWAEVNGTLARLVVAFDPDAVALDDLVGAVDETEQAHGLGAASFSERAVEHPADVEPLARIVVESVADVAALSVSVAGAFLRRVPAMPVELSAVVSLFDADPRLRRVLAQRMGRNRVDAGLAFASAAAQGLAFGPIGLVTDLGHRAVEWTEASSRHRAWLSREPELCREPSGTIGAPEVVTRALPIPDGPIERYAQLAGAVSLAAGAATALLTSSIHQGGALFVAGLPKAAHLGREAFAARLTHALCARGMVVMAPEVLRRLDRVDAVVLDDDLGAVSVDMVDDVTRVAQEAGVALVSLRSSPPARANGAVEPSDATSVVADLQRDGRVVAVVTARRSAALLQADCGIGLLTDERPTPWGADILCGPDLDDVAFVIEAARTAREVSRQAVVLASAGNAVASIFAMSRTGAPAARGAANVVNLASLTSMALGAWAGIRLDDRPRRHRADPTPWHALAVDDVLARLETRSDGLSESDERHRRVECASAGRSGGVLRTLMEELATPLTPVLGVGAGLSAALGSVVDAAVVASVLGANAAVGVAQRLQTDRTLEHLEEAATRPVRVLRAGEVRELAPDRLVVGDVVLLEFGAVVPADCRILESAALEVDESSLTGEAFAVRKGAEPSTADSVAERRSMLYAGTTVTAGWAHAVVVARGADTEAGRAADAAPERVAQSGVERRMADLADATLPLVLGSGAALALAGLLHGVSPRRVLGTGVALAVSAVPEGLPFVSTTAQVASARRIAEHDAIVREPRTVEALGRVDVLCFDKTGTLTEGRVRLQRVSDGNVDEPVVSLSEPTRRVLRTALRATPLGDEGRVAHATDQAVLDGAIQARVDVAGNGEHWTVLSELPFEADRAYHAVRGRVDGEAVLSVKGAPEVVLPRCTTWRRGSDAVAIDAAMARECEHIVDRLAAEGYRVLAVARRPDGHAVDIHDGDVEQLELLGFLAFADAVRPTATRTVDDLRLAGVDIAMVTGDHPTTARAVAQELDLLNGGDVLTGVDLDAMTEDELRDAIARASVFARVTPSHKTRIVEALQRNGRVVAMTGDGANDAAAIRLADVGIALGRRGSTSAREAADLVVTDDAIETIGFAILEGRATWRSVRDALAILLGGNLGEILFTVAGSALQGDAPLNARQILLVNLLTDLLPSMAIAVRPPMRVSADQLLAEGPSRSLGGPLRDEVIVRAVATTFGAGTAWIAARMTGRTRRANTIALAALVGTQLGQTMTIGRRSPIVLMSGLMSTAALVGAVQTPGVSRFFGCTPLGPVGWSIAASSSLAGTASAVVLRPAVQTVTGAISRTRASDGDRGGDEQPPDVRH